MTYKSRRQERRSKLSPDAQTLIEDKEKQIKKMKSEVENLEYPEKVEAKNLSGIINGELNVVIEKLTTAYGNKYKFVDVEADCSVYRNGEVVKLNLYGEIHLKDQDDDMDDEDDKEYEEDEDI